MLQFLSIIMVALLLPDQTNFVIENTPGDVPVLAIIAGVVYEVLARIIPTVKDYTIVGRFIKWVHRFSEYLNVKAN